MQKITDPITLEICLIYDQEHFHPCKTKNLQNHLLCFLDPYLYAKNQVDLSHITKNTVDSRTVQSDWHRVFLTSPN